MDPNIFEKILNEFVTSYPHIDVEYVEEFLTNIILVLTGVRLGYLSMDLSSDHPHEFQQLSNYVKNIFGGVIDSKFMKDGIYLIYLHQNQSLIDDILNTNDINKALGIILGYVCPGSVGPMTRSFDRYSFTFMAKHIFRSEFALFAMGCNVDAFTQDDRNKLYNMLNQVNNVLNNYGYTVTIDAIRQPANSKRYYPITI